MRSRELQVTPAMKTENFSVLVVDDEPLVLDAIQRHHGRQFTIQVARSGAAALRLVETSGPFAVIISDYNMPGMDGVTLLARMREISPATVRVLLTGQADVRLAMDAVTRGAIFRFVTKPCTAEEFEGVVKAAFEQHRILVAERELLEQTLAGAVRVLADILALASPDAFGRAARAKDLARGIALKLCPRNAWSIETAAILSQVGLVTLPSDVLDRHLKGASLTPAERVVVEQAPATTATLLGQVPRLEEVRELIRLHSRRFDGTEDGNGPVGERIPLGARILAVAFAYEEVLRRVGEPVAALERLKERSGAFDPHVVDALAGLPTLRTDRRRMTLAARQLAVDMILDQDALNQSGAVVVPRGQRITAAILARLRGHIDLGMLQEPIRVVVNDVLSDPSPSRPASAPERLVVS
jgi:response regulator RpfG family c-di-GMP phosphodiesterase